MKTKLIIEIDTSNMNKIYSEDNPEDFTVENEITEAVEEQIHQAVIEWIKSNLTEESLQEALLNNCIPEFEFLGVDGWDSLDDYGNIKITLENENTQEKEVLTNLINNTPIEEKSPEINKVLLEKLKNNSINVTDIDDEDNEYDNKGSIDDIEIIEEQNSDNEDEEIS